MILIPLGMSKEEVRRPPWVSYAVILLSFGLFLGLYVLSLASGVPARVERASRLAAEFYLKRPYLEVPGPLLRLLDEQTRTRLAQAQAAQIRSGNGPADWEQRLLQKIGNGLTEEAYSRARSSPFFRYALISSDPKLAAFLAPILHASWLHLIFNLLLFYVTAPFLEDLFGRALFAGLYLVSALSGIAAHMLANPIDPSPFVGASAAIAGVMGAFLLRLGMSRIEFLWMPLPLAQRLEVRFFVPAFLFLPIWAGSQWFLAARLPAVAGADLASLAGGFAAGVACAGLIMASGVERRHVDPRIEKEISWKAHGSLVAAMQSEAQGDLTAARKSTREVLVEEPRNPDAWRYAYEVCLRMRDGEGAAEAASWLLDNYIKNGERQLARTLIEEAMILVRSQLPTTFYLRAGGFLEKERKWEQSLELYAEVIKKDAQSAAALRALLRTAEICRELGDPGTARRTLERASAHPECRGGWKEAVEQGLRQVESEISRSTYGVRHRPIFQTGRFLDH